MCGSSNHPCQELATSPIATRFPYSHTQNRPIVHRHNEFRPSSSLILECTYAPSIQNRDEMHAYPHPLQYLPCNCKTNERGALASPKIAEDKLSILYVYVPQAASSAQPVQTEKQPTAIPIQRAAIYTSSARKSRWQVSQSVGRKVATTTTRQRRVRIPTPTTSVLAVCRRSPIR